LAISTANSKVSNPDLTPTAAPSIASAGVNRADADVAPGATTSVTSTARAPQGDAAEIAFLVKSGAELMANGDVAAARLMFQHAAEAGSAEGAFALAETYDPSMFQKLRRREAVTLDIALARSWYEKARNLGSTVARERIVRLTQLPE
jgi:TPR repeat protein